MYNLDHFGHYYLILVPLFHMIYMYLQKIFDVKITSHKKSWLWASAIAQKCLGGFLTLGLQYISQVLIFPKYKVYTNVIGQ